MSVSSKGLRGASKLPPELSGAVRSSRKVLVAAGLFSGLINLLALSSSLYMLQVYDRVIPSHSVPTLIGLSIGMMVLFAGHGLLDVVRTRLMGRLSIQVDRQLRRRAMALVLLLPLRMGGGLDPLQPVRDVDQIRAFTASGAPVALFDMPWMPFYLGLVWLLHPWLGILATGGALFLVCLTVLTDLRGREPTRDMMQSGAQRLQFAELHRRNSAAIHSMGMSERVLARWDHANERFLADQTATADITGTYGAVSRVIRLMLQSAVLGLGAYLVILGQATGGVMIAASILVSRALAPIEIAIANWRGFLSARQSAARLAELFRQWPAAQRPLPLQPPVDTLDVQGLWVAPPGKPEPVVVNASFRLEKGSALGIVGPSASGKSSLVRAMIGAWPVARGAVRLDGASLDQWSPDELGRHIGYLPQEVELIDGTVAENIARFEVEAPAEAIIEAARQAGVHDLIVRLPNGYDTRIGELGSGLSAGQRQRVALARALYRNPFLVVLDEPNSNLDQEGEAALLAAIAGVRERKGIVVVVAHRAGALSRCDRVLLMKQGQPPKFGTPEEIQRFMAGQGGPSPPHAPSVGPVVAEPADGAAPAAAASHSEAGVRLRIITE